MRAIITLLAVLAAVPSAAQNWPQFRGATAGIAADDPRLPDTWSTTENVAWKLDVPGRSWSSPVVWGNHVFIVTAIDVKEPNKALKPVPSYLAGSLGGPMTDRKSTRLNSSHTVISYAVFCL